MKLIKINFFTIYFLILLFLCGLIKEGIIIFLIVFIHELGHVLIAKILKFKIISITIYPYGGYTKINKDINTPINKDLILALGGILFQLILFLLLFLIFKFNLVTNITYNQLLKYNTTIILFNLLPIIPLDGSIILNLLMNKFLSFKNSYLLNIFISIFSVIFFLSINYIYALNNYLIGVYLITKIVKYAKEYHLIYNKFLLERHLKDYNFKKIKNIKSTNINKLQKDKLFFFFKNNKWINEKKYLKDKFKS